MKIYTYWIKKSNGKKQYINIDGYILSCERLLELAKADVDNRCMILPVKLGTPIWSTIFCSIDENGIEHPTFPWEFSTSMLDKWGIDWHLTEKDAEMALH